MLQNAESRLSKLHCFHHYGHICKMGTSWLKEVTPPVHACPPVIIGLSGLPNCSGVIASLDREMIAMTPTYDVLRPDGTKFGRISKAMIGFTETFEFFLEGWGLSLTSFFFLHCTVHVLLVSHFGFYDFL